jgi:glycosylphosphatidylinositol transamidase (GPIT) subunit GPI8
MKVEGNIALQYDLQKYCKMEIDHGTGTVYLTVNQPDVVITDWHAEVMNKNREWVHEKNFDNAELELQEQLKQQALVDAKNKPDFYEKAKNNTREQLLKLFKAVKPHGVEIKDVVVNYNIERRSE